MNYGKPELDPIALERQENAAPAFQEHWKRLVQFDDMVKKVTLDSEDGTAGIIEHARANREENIDRADKQKETYVRQRESVKRRKF